MDKLRLAIVGCGTIAQLNVPGYLKHDRCEIVVLCDPQRNRAERKAKEWGITPRVYTNFIEVLNDPEVDCVELLTPTGLHAQQSIDALEAGKHVSCQKPMATSIKDADRVVAAAGRAQTKYRVTENFLFYPPLTKAKELLDAGSIGDPSLVRIRTIWGNVDSDQRFQVEADSFAWRRDTSVIPGGLLYDDGWHKYATVMWWFGDVVQITSMVTNTEDFMVDAPSAAICRFSDGGRLGVLEYTHAKEMPMRSKYYPNDEFFEIHGAQGSILVTRCSGEMLDMPPVMLITGTETTSYQVPMDWIEGFNGSAANFIDSILDNKQPDMDANFSRKVLQVALSIYKSSELQRPIDPNTLQD